MIPYISLSPFRDPLSNDFSRPVPSRAGVRAKHVSFQHMKVFLRPGSLWVANAGLHNGLFIYTHSPFRATFLVVVLISGVAVSLFRVH